MCGLLVELLHQNILCQSEKRLVSSLADCALLKSTIDSGLLVLRLVPATIPDKTT